MFLERNRSWKRCSFASFAHRPLTGQQARLNRGKTHMNVTVYSTPGCPQCVSTYRAFLIAGIDFEVVTLKDNEDALAYVKGLGHLQAPVVVVGEQHWAGYRPDRITAVKRDLLEQGVKLTPRDKDADKGTIDAMIDAIKAKMTKDIEARLAENALATV